MEETDHVYENQSRAPFTGGSEISVPSQPGTQRSKKQRDEEIRRIFTGESDKFIVLVGPCSADNEDTVCEYVRKLKTVADKVSDKLMIIREFIQISPVPQVTVTKECFISQTLIKLLTFLPELLLSARCT